MSSKAVVRSSDEQPHNLRHPSFVNRPQALFTNREPQYWQTVGSCCSDCADAAPVGPPQFGQRSGSSTGAARCGAWLRVGSLAGATKGVGASAGCSGGAGWGGRSGPSGRSTRFRTMLKIMVMPTRIRIPGHHRLENARKARPNSHTTPISCPPRRRPRKGRSERKRRFILVFCPVAQERCAQAL